jgi:hypothetical protein
MWAKASTQRFATKRVACSNLLEESCAGGIAGQPIDRARKTPRCEKKVQCDIVYNRFSASNCPRLRLIEQVNGVINYHFAQICMPGGSPVN